MEFDGFIDESEVEDELFDEITDGLDDIEECLCCGADVPPMGTLGTLTWYRCVYCGTEFHS